MTEKVAAGVPAAVANSEVKSDVKADQKVQPVLPEPPPEDTKSKKPTEGKSNFYPLSFYFVPPLVAEGWRFPRNPLVSQRVYFGFFG